MKIISWYISIAFTQAWEALERAEHERELALREELMRYALLEL